MKRGNMEMMRKGMFDFSHVTRIKNKKTLVKPDKILHSMKRSNLKCTKIEEINE